MNSFKFCVSIVLVGFASVAIAGEPTRSETAAGGDTPAAAGVPAMPAEAKVIKTCETTIKLDPALKPMVMKFEIIDSGGILTSKMTQDGNSETSNAKKEDFEIRKNLSGNSNPQRLKMNEGENHIALAMKHMSSKVMKKISSVGKIKLSDVRSVTTYTVGIDENAMTPLGSTTIVEARDAKGKVMGSFLGGFAITPCK